MGKLGSYSRGYSHRGYFKGSDDTATTEDNSSCQQWSVDGIPHEMHAY